MSTTSGANLPNTNPQPAPKKNMMELLASLQSADEKIVKVAAKDAEAQLDSAYQWPTRLHRQVERSALGGALTFFEAIGTIGGVVTVTEKLVEGGKAAYRYFKPLG